jgi:hypothetical protein
VALVVFVHTAASVIKTLVVGVVAPAIRQRSAATLVAAIIVASACGTARAAGETLTGDQVLARAAASDGIAGYNVPIHFAVRLLRPIGAKGAVEGVATFTAPEQAALAITQAPPPIGTFFRGTYTIDMVPQAWAAKYHVSSVSTSVVGGAPVYVLKAQPVPATATIDGVTFQVGQSDFAPLSADWLYHDGSSIRLSFVNQRVGNLTLPRTATISVAMPKYALNADANYGTYAIRVGTAMPAK